MAPGIAAVASPHLFHGLINHVELVLHRHAALPTVSEHVEPNPDPAVASDAGQFIRVELLNHIEECSEEGCSSETRIFVSTHDDAIGAPYCNAHAHVLFADWMVGA